MPGTAFWKHKPLDELDREEWESLCDGCGRCCLLKIEDEDSGELYYTNVACRYYDNDRSRCSCYGDRTERVPECIRVTPEVAREARWLPDTCAYRLLAEGKPLFDW
ncbi:MAG TPA: YcgN family cysteine cluster protein, partial [Gammaproteobacteria bacterium]|nr:YcgN family cysteine cluster protein [Gammaproteobacteria bacterium]